MIDTHSHLFAEEFAEDLPAVIERAKAAGVSKVLMPNIDDTTIEAMLSVCTAYQGYCFPMIGFHPTSVDADSLFRIHEMKKNILRWASFYCYRGGGDGFVLG